MEQNSQMMYDEIKPEGLFAVYKVPAEIFDPDKIHFKNNYLMVKKEHRINVACHGVQKILNPATRIRKKENTVLDNGRARIADIMAGRIPADPITTLAIGSGGYNGPVDYNSDPPRPLGNDPGLYAEFFSKNIDSIEQPNIAANTYIAYLLETEVPGAEITEWGLKTASGVTFSRVTTRPVFKENGFVYVIRWTIQH